MSVVLDEDAFVAPAAPAMDVKHNNINHNFSRQHQLAGHVVAEEEEDEKEGKVQQGQPVRKARKASVARRRTIRGPVFKTMRDKTPHLPPREHLCRRTVDERVLDSSIFRSEVLSKFDTFLAQKTSPTTVKRISLEAVEVITDAAELILEEIFRDANAVASTKSRSRGGVVKLMPQDIVFVRRFFRLNKYGEDSKFFVPSSGDPFPNQDPSRPLTSAAGNEQIPLDWS